MSTYYYNDSAEDLIVPLDVIPDALNYARKHNIHKTRIIRSESCDIPLDLSPLTNDNNIYSLYIKEDINFKKVNFEPLYTLKNLKGLYVSHKKGCIDFSAFNKLDYLHIIKCDSEIPPLNLPVLKRLMVFSSKNVNCHFLSLLHNLRHLILVRGNIENFSGIESAINLEDIDLFNCSRLIDISEINVLPKLSELYVEKCKHLSNYSFLKRNKTLKDIFLTEIDSLDFVPEMKRIEKVMFWTLKDGNLNPLFDAPSLKAVHFFPDRKYYSHKRDEIARLINKNNSD